MSGRHQGPKPPFGSRAWPYVLGGLLVLGPVAVLLVLLVCEELKP